MNTTFDIGLKENTYKLGTINIIFTLDTLDLTAARIPFCPV